jgi:hypothetical protein
LLHHSKIAVALLAVLVSLLPSSIFATPLAQQGNFKVSLSPSPEPSPSPCYFDPTLDECQPIDGTCPPGFGFNENDQCVPTGKCPDGYGRLNDDETGKCYKNSDIKICPDGYITHKNSECPPPHTTPYPTPDPSPEPI